MLFHLNYIYFLFSILFIVQHFFRGRGFEEDSLHRLGATPHRRQTGRGHPCHAVPAGAARAHCARRGGRAVEGDPRHQGQVQGGAGERGWTCGRERTALQLHADGNAEDGRWICCCWFVVWFTRCSHFACSGVSSIFLENVCGFSFGNSLHGNIAERCWWSTGQEKMPS